VLVITQIKVLEIAKFVQQVLTLKLEVPNVKFAEMELIPYMELKVALNVMLDIFQIHKKELLFVPFVLVELILQSEVHNAIFVQMEHIH
jgi:glycopeptide antibiotics resistance protein